MCQPVGHGSAASWGLFSIFGFSKHSVVEYQPVGGVHRVVVDCVGDHLDIEQWCVGDPVDAYPTTSTVDLTVKEVQALVTG